MEVQATTRWMVASVRTPRDMAGRVRAMPSRRRRAATRSAASDRSDALINIESLQFSDVLMKISGIARADFNSDIKSDLVLHNSMTGEVHLWQMNGATVTSADGVTQWPLAWQIQNTGDYTGDGKNDLVWRDTKSGEIQIWQMDSATIISAHTPAIIPTDWVIS